MSAESQPKFDFSGVPRHWFGGSPFKTHVLNALHVLLFYGERYMIRTLNEAARTLPRDRYPRVAEQVRWFSRQEAEHAQGHRLFWETLRREGFAIDGLCRLCQWVGDTILPKAFPRALNLATTVAIEHNTAVFADVALRTGAFADMHPQARALFEWHCAEEIEHKAVVFDVLAASSSRPYFMRLAGMAMAILVLGTLTGMGAAWLLLQDREAWRHPLALGRDAWELFFGREALLIQGIRRGWGYFRPDFHPNDIDSRELAERALGRMLAQ